MFKTTKLHINLNPNPNQKPKRLSIKMASNEESEEYTENGTSNLHHHFSPYFGGNASEFIVPKTGRIDITSHQMGSGIYGLSEEFLDKFPANRDENAEEYVFKWQTPYLIRDQEECNRYVRASIMLSDNLETLRNEVNNDPQMIVTEEVFIPIAHEFIKNIQQPFDRNEVTESITKFWKDYWNRKDFVEMPINYILRSQEMDGVFSDPKTECHRWSRGNVLFLPNYPIMAAGDVQPVNYILTRSGIEKPVFCLGYKYNGKNWIYEGKVRDSS